MEQTVRSTGDAFLGGRYRLIERIGSGAVSVVYRGRDEFLGRNVAIKLIRKAASAEDELRRYDDEVKLLARLNHHSLVTLLDAGVDRRDPDTPRIYLVMELIEGRDLRQRLSQGPLPARHAAQVGYDVSEALDYIHQHGIIHRDIKPANIMAADYGKDASRVRAKVTDFGIAMMIDSDQIADDNVSGTAGYLSPEQAKGEPLGPFSDIYSLGLVLLECLTGQTPFPGTAMESAVARLMRDPKIPADLDPQWQQLLKAMTLSEPAERPSTQEVVMALYDITLNSRGRHKVDPEVSPEYEERRMEAVRRYDVLDTPPDGAFDRITSLAARFFSVPVAIVSVVDHDRIWFKSHHGVDVEQIDRDPGLCASAILQEEPWIVSDAAIDPRTMANPLVAGEFGLQFYAGVPLRTSDDYNLGTLCVIDREPRDFDDDDAAALEDLAAVVMNDLEMRLESRALSSNNV